MDDVWMKVLTNPTIIIVGCGLGLILLYALGSLLLKSYNENKAYRDVTGKDDD
jgi:hypothetical protein